MAHARRKFFDGNQASGSSMALVALQRIGKLYAIAAEGKDFCVGNPQQLRLGESSRHSKHGTNRCVKPESERSTVALPLKR